MSSQSSSREQNSNSVAVLAGPFENVLIDQQEKAWRDWEVSGQRPEDHPAVAPYTISIPDTDFTIIGEVKVSERWKDIRPIQCNVCNRRRKFSSQPGFVAAHSNGWWYIIGPECGGASQVRAVRKETDDFRAREETRIAGRALNDLLEHRKDWQRRYKNALYNCAELTSFFEAMFAKVPSAVAILQGMAKRAKAGENAIVDGVLGFNEPFYARQARKTLSNNLRQFLLHGENESVVRSAISVATSEGRLAVMQQEATDGIDAIESVEVMTKELASFFEKSNLMKLHERMTLSGTKPLPIRLRSREGRMRVQIKTDGNWDYIPLPDLRF